MSIPPERLRDLAGDPAPAPAASEHVLVLGAGMAGLTAAYELRRRGFAVTILEAQPRVGGRIQTFREPFSDGLYGEAGAMRIPRAHDLVLRYVDRFGLETAPFVMENPRTYVAFGGERIRRGEFDSARHAGDFELQPGETDLPIGQRWEREIAPLLATIERHGALGWEEVASEYDQYSLAEFLESRGWSQGAIELWGLLTHMEPFMNSAFLEVLREEAGRWFTDVVTIPGGMDRLPRAFLAPLGDALRYGMRVIAIHQSQEGVQVRCRTVAGEHTFTADRAIITIPFSLLRHIEITPALSRGKQRAIRTLSYDAATKIFFQCRRRFWEEDDGIAGGGSVTDLPVRTIYYPAGGAPGGRGILLASYTWAEDARRWGTLAPDERLAQAIENVEVIHPAVRQEFELGASKVWHQDEFAGGAYALFEPGQQTHLYRHIIAPEGRLHFAGEHASLAHGWIQGAVESGLRCVAEILERAPAR